MGHRKSSSFSVGGQKVPQEKLWDTEDVLGQDESGTHGQGVSGSSSGGAGGSSGCADASQRLEAERIALLRAKQAELDAIEDRHDDLVRC
jgi:hypothetical protein